MRSYLLFAVLLVGLFAPRVARAQVGGVVTDPLVEANTLKSLAESVKTNANMAAQLNSLRAQLITAQKSLAFMRDTYAGVNRLAHLDVEQFFKEQADYFVQHNEITGEGLNLVRDISDNGLNGGYGYQLDDASHIFNQRLADAFSGAPPPPPGQPYDRAKAENFAAAVSDGYTDPAVLAKLVNGDPIYSPTDGLLQALVVQLDPSLTKENLRDVGLARKRQGYANVQLSRALNQEFSVGEAAGSTAKTSAITAASTSQVAEFQAQALTMQKAEQAAELEKHEADKKDLDNVRAATEQKMMDVYSQPVPNFSSPPSLEQR